MDADSERGRDVDTAGPTLYLESRKLDPMESLCTEIFEDANEGEEYRVVQLTSTRSFDSIHDAFDAQLAKINDPSEAAVIIMSPHSGDDSTVTEVGEDVPLYGSWVDPEDLTGISVAFSRLIERWEDTPGKTRICLRNIESLLPYHDTDLIYRFLNTVLATLQGSGADVHAHLRPAALEDREFQLLASLFARVVDQSESESASESEPTQVTEATGRDETSAPTAERPPAGDSPDAGTSDAPEGSGTTTTMSAAEIDTFLESTGYGVLAFAGSTPHAIPISYGYDADERRIYMQLSEFDGSEKLARLADSTSVSLVVTRYTRPDRWRSVIVDGELTPAAERGIDETEVLDAYAKSDLASVDVFSTDLSEISFEWYVLEPTEFSGRQSVGSP